LAVLKFWKAEVAVKLNTREMERNMASMKREKESTTIERKYQIRLSINERVW